jgi:hypothetical protein
MKLTVADRLSLPEFSVAVLEALEAKDKSIGWLADATKITYEHARKLVRGKTFPSKLLLPQIIKVLGLDKQKITQMVIADRLRKQFGEIPEAITGKTPRMVKLGMVLESLTDEQFQNLLGMAQGMAAMNNHWKVKVTK